MAERGGIKTHKVSFLWTLAATVVILGGALDAGF